MFVPHPLDLIAVLMGIFLAIRKSDVRAEDRARHPRVRPEDFAIWQARALAAYTVGTRACFIKVLTDFAFLAVLRRVSLELWLQRSLGVALDVVWVAAMIACWLLARRARLFARTAGIDLSPRPRASPDPAEVEPPAQARD